MPTGCVTVKAQLAKVRHFVNYTTHLRKFTWLSCSSLPNDAASLGFQVSKNLLFDEVVMVPRNYTPLHSKSSIDVSVADRVYKALKHHWYIK